MRVLAYIGEVQHFLKWLETAELAINSEGEADNEPVKNETEPVS